MLTLRAVQRRVVAAIGQEARGAAAALGDKRGAGVSFAQDWATFVRSLPDKEAPAVLYLVATTVSVDAVVRIMDWAADSYRSGHHVSVGLLVRSNHIGLEAAVAATMSAASVSRIDADQWLVGPEATRSGARMRWASRADDPRSRIRARSELLFLLGYCSGPHFWLGTEKLAACPDGISSLDTEFRRPDCAYGLPCQIRDKIVRAEEIGTRRLVALSCLGVTDSDYMYASSSTIGHRILEHNKALQALLTTLRPCTLTDVDQDLVYYLVNRGLPFGEIAVRMNVSRRQRGLPCDIFCFGDPETAICNTMSLVEPTIEGDGAQVLLTPGTVRRDVFFHDAGLSNGGPPWLVEGTQGVVGVVGPDGEVYLTVPSGADRIMLRPWEFRAYPSLDPKLCRDLHELSWILEHWPSEELLDEAITELSTAQELLRRSPSASQLRGRVLDARIVDDAVESFNRSLEVAATNTLEAMARSLCSSEHQVSWGSVVGPMLVNVCGVPATCTCEYCGGVVDEMRTAQGLDAYVWCVGCCRRCGGEYSGSSVSAHWIRLSEGPICAGDALAFEVPIRNPYTMGLNAFAFGVLQGFVGVGDVVRTPVERSIIDGAGSKSVLLGLEIPVHFAPGTYVLIVNLVIGGEVGILRRPVVIGRRSALHAPSVRS